MYDHLSAFMLLGVSRRFVSLALVPVFLMIGACGGSSHSSSSSTAAGGAPSSSSTTTGSITATTATSTTTTSHKPKHFPTGSVNVRVPATFVVRPGGKLSPPQISIPDKLAVQVTVVSGDGRSHRVVVMTPSQKTLSVPAHGRVAVLISGLKVGRYPIELDGTMAGLLVTGAQPGP